MGSSIPPFPKAGFGTGTALVPLDTSAPQPPPASLLVPFLPSLILQKKVKAKQRNRHPIGVMAVDGSCRSRSGAPDLIPLLLPWLLTSIFKVLGVFLPYSAWVASHPIFLWDFFFLPILAALLLPLPEATFIGYFLQLQ